MRNRHYSSEDTERDEAKAVCWAYNKRGAICRKPAIGLDYRGGWPVCREHLDAYLKREEAR